MLLRGLKNEIVINIMKTNMNLNIFNEIIWICRFDGILVKERSDEKRKN